MTINQVAVIGAGTMGNGIAQAIAMADKSVTLYDISQFALQRGMTTIEKSLTRFVKAGHMSKTDVEKTFGRITHSSHLEETVSQADLVIEAIPEQLKLKQEIFEQLDQLAKSSAILATNTSELSVTAIASATSQPHRVIGMHWFNPAPVMKLIEVVKGLDTSKETIDAIQSFSRDIGKESVLVKDYQGFVTTRALSVQLIESMRMLEEGVASPEDIDKSVRLGLNYPMGPLELSDYIGLDTLLYASDGMVEAYGDRFRPPQILRKLVEAGHLGRKTGKGFYNYTE
ncbi:3-hydroxyacyl-CoA dehydrogenase family protein [Hazenella sp. IB182357]|uniref:3-hydroxyacyl-CoA dehydrogenase family protein n=1 Tax=Polycladospora coralii TaxID=2771432 RepID=A0A926NEE4_9BACL|nr:3-hydroxyacyl-CoA dehydrogenase family protein [Polycladospora coralii]MBD1371913.1 3-hydroxyacyl-CoA dehydrogenase family protein [Polycladospora coralii]MBS7529374.1 3-hydroxyacyl-CoA dehydrogenase family protein [Polycladospora coralii]